MPELNTPAPPPSKEKTYGGTTYFDLILSTVSPEARDDVMKALGGSETLRETKLQTIVLTEILKVLSFAKDSPDPLTAQIQLLNRNITDLLSTLAPLLQAKVVIPSASPEASKK